MKPLKVDLDPLAIELVERMIHLGMNEEAYVFAITVAVSPQSQVVN